MERNTRTSSLDVESRSETAAGFMTRVYQWMSIGVLLTAGISTYIGTNEALATSIASNRVLFWVLIIAQFGVVIGLSAMIQRMSAVMATGLFLLYSALTGVTLSTIFLIYTHTKASQIFRSSQNKFYIVAIFNFNGLEAIN